MEWFKNQNSRQDLFRTHTGQAMIRSACRQAVKMETLPASTVRAQNKMNSNERTRELKQFPTFNIETKSPTPENSQVIADYVTDNPFLEKIASVIDSIRLTSLPPYIDDDIIVHIMDNQNACVSVDTMGIKFAIIKGMLCVYPREDISERLKCGNKGQQKAIFLNNLTNKWSHGCNTSFDVIRNNIILQPSHRKLTASVKDLRTALNLDRRQKLNIQHVFNYIFYH